MPSDSTNLVRIGFLGCASIAKKNAIAILQEPSGCLVTAVASRSQEKAHAFVHDFMAPRLPKDQRASDITCFGGSSAYDELIQSSLVDVLYIPLPTVLHKEWVLKALKAGKHVLLEKPVALSAKDYKEMLDVAKEHDKYLKDGTMFVHHPRTKKFIQTVQDASVMGALKRVEAGFSFCGSDDFLQNDIRVKKDCDSFGCLGDLGWYVVRIALLVMGQDCPMTSAQVVDYQINEEGVPIDATCLVKFQDKVLSFHCGFTTQFRQYVHVVGTKSWASMNDFVLPKKHPIKYNVQSMNLTEYDLITEHACQTEEFDGPVQEVLMWQAFSRFVKAVESAGWQGDSEECREALKLSQISMENQVVLDALMDSIRKDCSTIEK